jgi:hypothetical protein
MVSSATYTTPSNKLLQKLIVAQFVKELPFFIGPDHCPHPYLFIEHLRHPGGGLGIFLFTTVFRTALGPTQPPIQWVPGAFSLGVKRQRREADHSPPSSAEVKNAWIYTSTPQYIFMA